MAIAKKTKKLSLGRPKRKVINRNTSSNRGSKDNGHCPFFFYRQIPPSKIFLDQLGAELVEWADTNPAALTIVRFLRLKKLNPKTFHNWCKKYPRVKEANDLALRILADNREVDALTGKIKERIFLASQAMYDPAWWKLEKDRAELKNVTPDQKETEFHIHLPKVEKVIPDKEEK